MQATCKVGGHSPWGPVQDVTVVAEGIEFVSTAGHGGFWLSPDRVRDLERVLPGWVPFSGSTEWLEEDCDVCAAALVWPGEFETSFVADAVSAYRDQGKPFSTFLASPRGLGLVKVAEGFRAASAHLWRRSSMGSPPAGSPKGSWWVLFRRGGATREVLMDYPDRQWYSDADLDRLSVGALV